MNYRTVFHTVGNILVVEGFILLMPLILAAFLRETAALKGFAAAAAAALIIGFLLTRIDRKNEVLLMRDSMVIVGLSWIAISLTGALPYYVSGEIPVFVEAFFETMSGFTTTGITVFNDVESVSRSILFWRSFTVWLGGMGVLVFMLAVLPRKGGSAVNLMKAESSSPDSDKIVPKTQMSAIILYTIYIILTIIDFIFLKLGGMSTFDAVNITFGTAGTGGFNIHDASIAYYDSDYISIVTTVFMFLFGVNYTLFFLMFTGRARDAFKNPELKAYAGITVFASVTIAFNTMTKYESFGRALINSSFAVTAMSSSTGFILDDFDVWPSYSKILLLALMFIGACSGSTSCGIKLSRMIIMGKLVVADVKRLLSPRSVNVIKYNGRVMSTEALTSVYSFIVMYVTVFAVSVLLVSINDLDMITTVSAVAAALNNVGCGFSQVGPSGSFSVFSGFSMVVLSVDMLAGRLEIFPILMMLYPRTWYRY
ncbi:MAG: TrkH family potassium uptake protein [Anaerovoracaceae bacterium]|nr:TrkH family potassium uptake protein [Bacillota bacterium]MDY2670572.1 TrkH family potassium uptake protein [Anaerovoracaceae bacterium]